MIDKENGGGKADATNAGINAARYPLIYCGDADSVLDPHSLEHVVRPFLEDPRTVACGGTVRIVNGCTVRGGVLEKVGLPRNPLALVQVVEYLRAFLGGRLGWSADQRPADRVRRIRRVPSRHRRGSGRLPRRRDRRGHGDDRAPAPHAAARGARYRVAFMPDPVCWTDAPEDLGTLAQPAQALAARARAKACGRTAALLRARQRLGGLDRIPVLRAVRTVEPGDRDRRLRRGWAWPLRSA